MAGLNLRAHFSRDASIIMTMKVVANDLLMTILDEHSVCVHLVRVSDKISLCEKYKVGAAHASNDMYSRVDFMSLVTSVKRKGKFVKANALRPTFPLRWVVCKHCALNSENYAKPHPSIMAVTLKNLTTNEEEEVVTPIHEAHKFWFFAHFLQ